MGSTELKFVRIAIQVLEANCVNPDKLLIAFLKPPPENNNTDII